MHVKGLIKESTFKKTDLQTMTQLTYIPGETSFKLHDVLINHADYAHDYQIIYHSNLLFSANIRRRCTILSTNQ
ncbi:DUF4432 family protein [Acinetobacter nectaris]|nr:DUF4432 family protein [Acinetobacter nectaris]